MNFETFITDINQPLVFKNFIDDWPARKWTLQRLAEYLKDTEIKCKVGPKFQGVFETQCVYLDITIDDFIEWCSGKSRQSNPLHQIDKNKYFCYLDYKYMVELFSDNEEILQSLDWGVFGLTDRSGSDSTIWIGSDGCTTPCHYDTYGFNLVAQISGRKKWCLFPPSDMESMYPTRIPYEESSVFSEVNITNTDFNKHSLFKNCHPYMVVLEPGDVLYVPKHWWHYVECLDTAVSINTWVEMEDDNETRVKEAITRILISSLTSSNGGNSNNDHLVNPNEFLQSSEVNFDYLQQALENIERDETATEHGSVSDTESFIDENNKGDSNRVTSDSNPVTSDGHSVTCDRNTESESNPVTSSSNPVTCDRNTESESNPITIDSNLVTINSNPLTSDSNPVTSESHPVTSGSNPVTSDGHRVTCGSNTVSKSIPVTTDSNLVTINSNPVTSDSNPVTSESHPVTIDSNLVTIVSNPVITDNDSVSESNPVVSESNQVTIDSNLVTISSNPVTSDSNPVTIESNPVTSESNPVSGESNKVTSDSNPVATDSNLVTLESNLVTNESHPVTIDSKPAPIESNLVTSNSYQVTIDNNSITCVSNPVTNDSNTVTTESNLVTTDSNSVTSETHKESMLFDAGNSNKFQLFCAKFQTCEVHHFEGSYKLDSIKKRKMDQTDIFQPDKRKSLKINKSEKTILQTNDKNCISMEKENSCEETHSERKLSKNSQNTPQIFRVSKCTLSDLHARTDSVPTSDITSDNTEVSNSDQLRLKLIKSILKPKVIDKILEEFNKMD